MRKVGMDIVALSDPAATGYNFYVKDLYSVLQKQSVDDLEIIGLTTHSSGSLSTPKRFFHDVFVLPRLAEAADVDILHQPIFSCPPSKKKVVWTLHDLRQLTNNERMSVPASLYWKKWLPFSAKYADKIVCISENTYNDACHYLPQFKDKITIIPNGIPDDVLSWKYEKEKADAAKKKFAINKPYFSAVGTIQPIKNYPFLIDVFASLRNEQMPDSQLVIIGKKGWDYDAVRARMAVHKLIEGTDVIITDYVSDDEKWSLMHDSVAFLFPSLYEGFGVPPLEAQALGVPVVASNTSSIPGVVGDGGLLCSPQKVKEWLEAIDALNGKRSKLIENGRKNITKYHWSAIANQWQDLYRSL